jgi:hypothetical protein
VVEFGSQKPLKLITLKPKTVAKPIEWIPILFTGSTFTHQRKVRAGLIGAFTLTALADSTPEVAIEIQ